VAGVALLRQSGVVCQDRCCEERSCAEVVEKERSDSARQRGTSPVRPVLPAQSALPRVCHVTMAEVVGRWVGKEEERWKRGQGGRGRSHPCVAPENGRKTRQRPGGGRREDTGREPAEAARHRRCRMRAAVGGRQQ